MRATSYSENWPVTPYASPLAFRSFLQFSAACFSSSFRIEFVVCCRFPMYCAMLSSLIILPSIVDIIVLSFMIVSSIFASLLLVFLVFGLAACFISCRYVSIFLSMVGLATSIILAISWTCVLRGDEASMLAFAR